MWRVIIVEDEKAILGLHARLLETYGPFQIVGRFESPFDALQEIPKLDVDALLLDIEMPRMTGLGLAQNLVENGIDVPVIFTTAHQQYAVQAFRVQALDYILKPMTPNTIKQLDERLQKYYGQKQKLTNNKNLHVQLYGEIYVKKGEHLAKWPTRLTEELFYYFLLHENKLCLKWRIIDDIWTHIEEKRALPNLYNTIYRMRQLFMELDVPIVIDRINDGYIMNTNNSIVIEPKEKPDALLLESKGYLWAYRLESIV
ncbi:response regulator [Paenibacillus sp. LHD-117]|uniref:LytR/AlgR family response regulator transcription factor n=1 Tax=Paenibacillus sp. LHD-117 TaxID=3071412 RepID=UPI0027E1B4AB|nr:response regulator [Paenibacillus sp. LHD-117]MDQ6423063.1 response regulator [Paenibacillus sp. LHD-117]